MTASEYADSSETSRESRLTRNSRKKKIAGVCAGLADYFGFNLCATRALAVIALVMVTPMAIVVYLAAAFLIPTDGLSSKPSMAHNSRRRKKCRRQSRADATPEFPADDALLERVKYRSRDLESRLATLERYVTSSRFELDRKFSRL